VSPTRHVTDQAGEITGVAEQGLESATQPTPCPKFNAYKADFNGYKVLI